MAGVHAAQEREGGGREGDTERETETETERERERERETALPFDPVLACQQTTKAEKCLKHLLKHHAYTLTLTHPHTHSLTHSLTHTHTHTLSLSLSLSALSPSFLSPSHSLQDCSGVTGAGLGDGVDWMVHDISCRILQVD